MCKCKCQTSVVIFAISSTSACNWHVLKSIASPSDTAQEPKLIHIEELSWEEMFFSCDRQWLRCVPVRELGVTECICYLLMPSGRQ